MAILKTASVKNSNLRRPFISKNNIHSLKTFLQVQFKELKKLFEIRVFTVNILLFKSLKRDLSRHARALDPDPVLF